MSFISTRYDPGFQSRRQPRGKAANIDPPAVLRQLVGLLENRPELPWEQVLNEFRDNPVGQPTLGQYQQARKLTMKGKERCK